VKQKNPATQKLFAILIFAPDDEKAENYHDERREEKSSILQSRREN